MNPQIAQFILEFLKRVDLKGTEVPAFNRAVDALLVIIQPPGSGDPT